MLLLKPSICTGLNVIRAAMVKEKVNADVVNVPKTFEFAIVLLKQ